MISSLMLANKPFYQIFVFSTTLHPIPNEANVYYPLINDLVNSKLFLKENFIFVEKDNEMLKIENLKALLKQSDADYEIIQHEKPILSTADAEALFDTSKAAPVFIMNTEKGLVSLIVKARSERFDFKKVKEKAGYAKFKMADRTEVHAATGYEAGAIPLIGHNLPCLLDSALLELDYMYGGTGHPNFTLKIKPADVVRLNNTTVIEIENL